jgi:hypothetical protein
MNNVVSDLEAQMLRRARAHMLTSLVGVVLAIVGFMMIIPLRRAFAADGSSFAWLTVVPIVSIVLIPAIGIWSTFKNLRCPACNGMVAMQVSANASIFGSYARKECRHCGQRIFGEEIVRRARRVFFISLAIVPTILIMGGIAAAVGSIIHK